MADMCSCQNYEFCFMVLVALSALAQTQLIMAEGQGVLRGIQGKISFEVGAARCLPKTKYSWNNRINILCRCL